MNHTPKGPLMVCWVWRPETGTVEELIYSRSQWRVDMETGPFESMQHAENRYGQLLGDQGFGVVRALPKVDGVVPPKVYPDHVKEREQSVCPKRLGASRRGARG